MRKATVLVVFSFIGSMLFSQNGNVRGAIIDQNGIVISGATVAISSLGKGAVSDLEGRFTLIDIPSGEHILKVRYLGFSEVDQSIVVIEDKTIFVNLVLKATAIRLKDVEVRGTYGDVRAVNTQKSNLNITNVVSTDQIGKFPDSNIGDALKRIPGIAVQVDQGEARNLIVRGLSPALNSVTINGSRIPSAEGDNRNIQLDLIPSDMIQTVEVSKTLTPDMEADALGGSVNLVTRTAPQGFRASLTAGSGLNFISKKRIWNGTALIGNRTKDNKFGWMLSASINDNDFGSDNIEARWADSFTYNSGMTDPEGEPILEESETNPYPKILEIQPHWIQRVRRSFAANFEYLPNNNNSLFFKTIYNWRDDRENLFVFEQEVLANEDIGIGDFEIEDGNLKSFPVLVSRKTQGGIDSKRHKNARLEDQRMQNYGIGGNHLIRNVKLDWMTSFSKASDKKNNERTAEFKSQYIVDSDVGNPKFPLFIPQNPSSPDDLSSFEYDEIIEENKFTKEEDVNLFINAALPVNFFGNEDGQVKFGVRGRFKSKLRKNNFFIFDQEDNFPTLMETPTTDHTDSGYLVGSQYRAGRFADEKWLGSLPLQDGSSVPDEFLRENFTVDENVYAGYLMSEQKVLPDLSVLAGLRIEHTVVKALANEIEEGSDTAGSIRTDESYTNFLPGIHLKYTPFAQTIFRFAWSNTLARPNYVDLVPTSNIVFSDQEIHIGNSKLNPAASSNFDLTGEYYFNKIGLVTAGFFNKTIRNFVYTFRSLTEDDSFGEGTTGFDLFQPLNGEEASLFGIELSLQHNFVYLPSFAQNFTLNLNYTFLNATTEGIRDINGVEREDLDLADTPPNLFNASLGYEGKKFTARLSANFSDAYINDVGGSAFEDIYYDRQFFLDFNAGYNMTENLSIYFGLNNITDQPLRFYQGIHERTAQVEYYDLRLTFGLKYDVFKRHEAK
ncbi:MAG: TonB-dependent receptor [Aurantibacter sp.]